MRGVPSPRDRALAAAVLPTPGSPSRSMGWPRARQSASAVASPSSARYPASSRRRCSSTGPRGIRPVKRRSCPGSGAGHRTRCPHRRPGGAGSTGLTTTVIPQTGSTNCAGCPAPGPSPPERPGVPRPPRRRLRTSWAIIDKAISAAVRAPMSRPTGVWTRRRSASDRPAAASTASPRRRLATRPMNGTPASRAVRSDLRLVVAEAAHDHRRRPLGPVTGQVPVGVEGEA